MSGTTVVYLALSVIVTAFVVVFVMVRVLRKKPCGAMLDIEPLDLNKEIIARAKKIGCLARWNVVAHVRAVVANDDFLFAYNEYYREVYSGLRKPTDKVRLNIKPTLTFWLETEAETPMHTGEDDEGWEIIRRLVEVATGIKYDDVDIDAFSRARDIIYRKDARIFVPFAGGMPNIEEQVKLYKRTTPDEAKAYFASKVPANT